MIKKKKIPIKSLVLILILVELICLVFAGILGEPGNDINLKTASWMNHPWRCFNQYTLISLGCGLTGWVFFLAFYLDTHRNTHSDIEHGSAEWDDPDTANKRMADLKHPENNRILSKHVNQALSGSKSFPNNNMIVVGAPGTGKSLFVIAPNILKCISSYLFMDPKGELVEKYGNYLQKNGYQIRVLNLKNMESSDRYNPFVYIRTEDDIPRLIMNIFKSVEPPDAQKGDPFWDDGCALYLQSLQTMYKGDGWKVFMDSCAVFLFLGSGRGAYDTQETISKMLGAATIEKASGSVSYGQNGSSSTSYDRLQRSLMDANEVAQMDKDSCIILPFASKPIIDKKYKPFHDPSYLKAKKYGPYTHPVEIFRDKNGNLHTVNHQEKFYFPDEGLQAKIRDDLKEGKSSGMLFELSEDEFCSLDLDDPKLNGPQGNLFLLQQLKKLEDDSATLKLQNAVNEKMNSVIYDTSDNTSSLEADEESAAETISVYDVRQSWDLSGNLEDVIRRYILELSEDEVSNITEAMNRHIPEKKIKDCLTLPPEKLCLMLQFYMKQAN